eukprot:4530579-Alexandrium_andersonii.AAC.1
MGKIKPPPVGHMAALRLRERPAIPARVNDHDLVEGSDVHVAPVDAERSEPSAAHRARGGAAGQEEVAHPVLGPADEDALRGAAH